MFQAVDYGVHKLWENNNVGVMPSSFLVDFLYFVLFFQMQNGPNSTHRHVCTHIHMIICTYGAYIDVCMCM